MKRDHIKEAARAHTNLTVMHAVMAILESGCVYGQNRTAEKIIALAKKEAERQLRLYDAARARANGGGEG